MIINLSPQVSSKELDVFISGDAITINGNEYDFSVIPDGATLPSDAIEDDYIIGNIERVSGVINLTLLFPINGEATESARFPSAINQTSGRVGLPS